MRRSSLLSLIALAILCGVSMGQMSTLPAAQAIADLPGPPKNPPIFSQMTVIWQGGLQYQNTIDMKGPVASIEREESQSTDQNPSPYHTKSTCKFDDDGHLIKCINEDSLGVSTTTYVRANGKVQSQNVSHHRTGGSVNAPAMFKIGRVSLSFRSSRTPASLNFATPTTADVSRP
jgi:hypothetical protein